MNPPDRRQNDNEASEVSEAFSLSLAEGERPRLRGKQPSKHQLRFAVDASRSSSVSGNLFLDSTGYLLGEPVELSLQNSSGRFGWWRLVPPHPYPLPQGEGTAILRLLKSGIVLTGTVRSAIQRRDA